MTEKITVPHTDHPLRHWDRTCPACVAGADARTLTARTDAEAKYGGYATKSAPVVSAEFARKLTRELVEAVKQCWDTETLLHKAEADLLAAQSAKEQAAVLAAYEECEKVCEAAHDKFAIAKKYECAAGAAVCMTAIRVHVRKGADK